jgi:hypothetical protein
MDYPGKVITKTQVTPTQTSASGNWTLDDQAAAIKNNNWPVALVPNPISKSLRFNSADGTNLTRTQTSSVTNSKIYTISVWVKRSGFGASQVFEGADSLVANYWGQISFASDNSLFFGDYNPSSNSYLQTTAVYRDPSAWYHIVGAYDTTQATASDRMKLYVNGVQLTSFSASAYPTQNTNSTNNLANNVQRIGEFYQSGVYNQFNGYMTEYNFIDGQALTPSSFGMTNPQTGQWIPLKYSGTYGTNGFYLNFKDATSTTTLGYDYSGNANNWTTNNFSVTAGSGNDSLTDVPTPWFAYNTTGDVGGVIRGNYSTLNPLAKGAGVVLSDGNLGYTSNATYRVVLGSIAVASGKYYWEVTAPSNAYAFGVADVSYQIFNSTTLATGNLFSYSSFNGDKYIGLSFTQSSYDTSGGISTSTILGFAVDFDTGTATIYRNGVSKGVIHTWTPGATYAPFAGYDTTPSGIAYFNFGQRPFAYTPPTGFRSLCTTNLPATAIGFGLTNQGDDYFNANLYTGTGSAFTLTGVGFQPDFGWFKGRNASSNHWLHDVVRGANPGLSSNSTAAEDTTAGQLTAFASDGYSLPNDTAGYLNFSGRTMVVWSWKAGGTGVSNTAGTITSTVSANTTAGFSIVTYTGNATSGATVGHGLGVAPNLIIVRNRTASAQNWQVYSSVLGATKRLFLDLTDAENTFSGVWNNTAPTSTVFSLGNATDVNGNTNNFVAYCFAAVPGYSAFGSWVGNGSTDGPFIYTGFRPRYLLQKGADVVRGWNIWDTARSPYNAVDSLFQANSSGAESTGGYNAFDLLSNGFKVRSADANWNNSGSTYIYMAFAESPFQFANAR